jgi:hypothetical protein
MPRKSKKPPVAENTGAVPYGQGQALADAQRQIPLGPPPGASPAPAGAAPPAAPTGGGGMAEAIAAAGLMAPPAPGGLAAPSARADEPITAGLPIGAGAGPGALGVPLAPEEDAALKQLILAFQTTGSPALARIIEVVRGRAEARNRMLTTSRNAAAAVPPGQRRPL